MRKNKFTFLLGALACGFAFSGAMLLSPMQTSADAASVLEDSTENVYELYMEDGAYVRMNTAEGEELEANNGIQFTTYMTVADYEKVKADGGYSFGIVIAPEDYVNDHTLTVNNLFGSGAVYGWEENTQKTKIAHIATGDFVKGEITLQGEKKEVYLYRGSLVNIKNWNKARNFVATAYSYDGETYKMAENTCTRSIYTVAGRAVADLTNKLTGTERTWVQTNYVDAVHTQFAGYFTKKTLTADALDVTDYTSLDSEQFTVKFVDENGAETAVAKDQPFTSEVSGNLVYTTAIDGFTPVDVTVALTGYVPEVTISDALYAALTTNATVVDGITQSEELVQTKYFQEMGFGLYDKVSGAADMVKDQTATDGDIWCYLPTNYHSGDAKALGAAKNELDQGVYYHGVDTVKFGSQELFVAAKEIGYTKLVVKVSHNNVQGGGANSSIDKEGVWAADGVIEISLNTLEKYAFGYLACDQIDFNITSMYFTNAN